MGNNNTFKEKLKSEIIPRHEVDWRLYDEVTTDPDLCVVLFDFRPDENNQISIRKGEKVTVQNWDITKDWCLVSNKNKSGYVPSKYLAPWTSLNKYPWYYGPISRNGAEYVLMSEVDGTFLVRESTTCNGQFCISLKTDGMTIHYKIAEESGQFYLTSEKMYNSLPDLVEALSVDKLSGLPTLLTYYVPKKHKPVIYEACPGIADKWELDRSELELLDKLGSGNYGDVYKATFIKRKKLAAIKTLKDTVSAEEFVKEVAIMKSMKHPNLVQLLGVCSKRAPFYIVMEFMSSGNLLQFLKNNSELTPTVLLFMATQISAGMAYLESQNYIHRDLAARNCLVGDDHVVKIADFGLARVINEGTYTSQSSPMLPIKWTAPEGLAYSIFSSKSDVWAFGILLYEIVTHGKIPYSNLSMGDVYQFLERGGRMDCPPNCPPKVYQLMRMCWEWDPDKRPTFREIRQELDDISCISKDSQNSQEIKIFNLKSLEGQTSNSHLMATKKADFKLVNHQNELSKNVASNFKKSKSVGDSSNSPKSENPPTLALTNELQLRFNQSDLLNFTTLLKNSLGTSEPPKPKFHPARANVHPPPIPTQKQKKIQSPPPLPPTKPFKSDVDLSSRFLKGQPPFVPLKPHTIDKINKSEKSRKLT